MKILNKTVSAGLAVLMLMTAVVPVSADDSTASSKEEVIYIMTNADGSVDGVYAVNIFGKGNVTDHGTYDNIKMLNTSDKINIDGDKITFSTKADKAYMQGTLSNTEIPWNIAIRYYLNGEEITPKNLAGKSGKLEIKFKVAKNDKCGTDFYDSYALQAAFTLDTEKCTNIKTDGATIANVGSDKQISYTILPGKGIDTSITADVNDFEMDAVAINGVKMNLDIEVDDSEITDKVNELSDGITSVDDGAKKLSDGTDELSEGVKDLKSGAKTVNSGAVYLKSGAQQLANGSKSLKSGAGEVNNAASSVKEGAEQVLNGALALQGGILELKNGAESLKSGSSQLSEGAESMDSGIKDLSTGISTLQEGLDELTAKSKSLTSGSGEVLKALKQIQTALNTVSADANDIIKLTQASGKIKSAISDLNDGAKKLQNNLGYSQYKVAMAQNDLDIDELKESNDSTIQRLTDQIKELSVTLTQISGIQGQKDQAKQLKDQIDQLSNIVKLLQGNNGAINGTEEYLDTISENVAQLCAGLDDLNNEYAKFDKSINELADHLSETLVDISKLSAAINTLTAKYAELDKGINDYTAGVSKIASGYSQLTGGFSQLAEGSRSLTDGSKALDSGVDELYSGISKLYGETDKFTSGTQSLSDGTKKLSTGSTELFGGISDLASGATELSNGAEKLTDGTKELSDGADNLYDGVDKLKSGATELSDGTGELKEKTSGMDTDIENKIDDVISSIQGSDSKTVSFVSDKNTSVESVQFVIKTDAIKIPEEKQEDKPAEKKLSFWQKLLKLFGLYDD